MRRPQGYGLLTFIDHDGCQEFDTFTCSHCDKIVKVKPFCDPADMGGHCRMCNKLICKDCVYKMKLGKPCDPVWKRIERMEKKFQEKVKRRG